MSDTPTTGIAFGRPTGIVRLFGERISQRLDLRALTICGVLLVLAVAVAVLTLASG